MNIETLLPSTQNKNSENEEDINNKNVNPLDNYPVIISSSNSINNNDKVPSNKIENFIDNNQLTASSSSSSTSAIIKRKFDDNNLIDDNKKQKYAQGYIENPESNNSHQQPPPPPSPLDYTNSFNCHQQPQQYHNQYHVYPTSMTPSLPMMDNMGAAFSNYQQQQQQQQQQQSQLQPQHHLPVLPSSSSSASSAPILSAPLNNDVSDCTFTNFSAENFLKPDIKNIESPYVPEETLKIENPSNNTMTLNTNEESLKIQEKLKEMGEISVKPVNKSSLEFELKRKDSENSNNGISIEIKKKSGNNDKLLETDESKRITNLRKNIREVMDENQLDATTLAAQRQESERLARVQEQQKLIRELQRQMAVERQNNRTQNRVLSLLQGQNSLLKNNRVSLPSSSGDMYIVKGIASEVTFKGSSGFVDVDKINSGNLTPSVSIAPVRRNKVATASSSEGDDDDSKKEVVTIVDSSSEDDCIVLSDDDEEIEEEPEDDPHNSGLHVNDAFNIPDDKGRVVVNIGHPEGEPDIFIAPQIARVIKPHQIGGVRFLFDNIIESTERFSTSTGFGCILAHSMGLGKTLQIVCFCDIFLRHTNSKSILCIMPINTLQNWVAEFNMWLPDEPDKTSLKAHGEVRPRNFRVFILNDQHKTLSARSKVIMQWAREGGVLLIGYELFRLLSLKLSNKKKKSRKMQPEKEEKVETPAHREIMENIYAALVKPGPDLVICDEGHRIKNSHASISVALKQIRSKRRIVLTGYPLQNNLLEYWCMVDFVRPNYLGTKTEFSNMFERPIQNGQCIDSTPQDIKLMRYRAHVLHSLLVGFVQRRSHAVLQNTLPQKEEYVILVRMTSFQRKLYNVFMNEVVRTKAVPNPLKAFAVCCKIWNHPDVLYNFLKKREADLDLELEEVENEASKKCIVTTGIPGTLEMVGGEQPIITNSIIPTSAAGRRRRAQKKSKEIIKNGKNIPAIEVAPQNIPIPENLQQQRQQHQHQQQQQHVTVNEENINMNTLNTIKTEERNCTSLSALAEIKIEPSLLHEQQQRQYQQQQQQQQQQHLQQQQSNNMIRANNPQLQTMLNSTSVPPPLPLQPYGIPYTNYNSYSSDGGYYSQYDNYYSQDQYPTNDYNAMNYNSQLQNNFWDSNSSFFGGYNPANVGESTMNSFTHTDSSFGGNSSMSSSQSSSNKPFTNISNNNSSTGAGGNTNFENNSSSEIVDLDTKEIRTLETRMNEFKMFEDLKKEKIDGKDKKIKDDDENEKIEGNEDDIKKDDETLSTIEKEIKPITKEDGIPYDWAVELMKGYVPDLLENSPKMVIFFRLLDESLRLGDRILVFSQSLLTLNLIERFLQMTKLPTLDYNWVKNKTYFRLDGSTTAIEREKLINEFNANPDIHLFLVSTRAGSLGINLVGANRVIVFDASWNPCHDTQAVCRVYRYGQKKPCFVYRLVMDNCLEKKIYDRQVNKQGMSDRVVDECNPDAHLSIKEVTNLCYDIEDDSEWKDIGLDCKDKYLDIVMQKIIEMHRDLLSKEPFQHESLLVDRKEKKLSQAEKRLAQRGYEMEKRAATKPSSFVYHSVNTQYRIMRTADGSIVHRPVASVRPMQAEMTDKVHNIPRPGGVRPTRWIPAEVWQRQGMTAQEMTLPLDVVIPTSSGDKTNIVLKAGQKVMVLKSPKGIYMQLESGKIIAIRTSFKMNQNNRTGNEGGTGDKIGVDCDITTTNLNDDKMKKIGNKPDNLQEISQQQKTKLVTMPTTVATSATSGTLTNQKSSIESTPLQDNKDQNIKIENNYGSVKSIFTPNSNTNNMISNNIKQKPIEVNQTTYKIQQHSNIYSPARQTTTSTNSKNFNVQHLIETKKPTNQQQPLMDVTGGGQNRYSKMVLNNTGVNKNEDSVMVDNDSDAYTSQTKKPMMLHRQHPNQIKFPAFTGRGTKYGPAVNLNTKPYQHQSSSNSNMANVRPQNFQETNMKWDRSKPMENKNAFQTITIDDDFEPPLREKINYKPNLTERKPKPVPASSVIKNPPQRMLQQQLQSKQQPLFPTTKQDRSIPAAATVVSPNEFSNNVPLSIVPSAASSINNNSFFSVESSQSSTTGGIVVSSSQAMKQPMNNQLQTSTASSLLQSSPQVLQKQHHQQQQQSMESRQKEFQQQNLPSLQSQQLQSVSHKNQKSNEMLTSSPSKSNNSSRSSKTPSIKNIPAPYPSIYAPHGQHRNLASNTQTQQCSQQQQSQMQNSQYSTQQQPTTASSTSSSSSATATASFSNSQQNNIQEKIQNSSPGANTTTPSSNQQNTNSSVKTTSTTDGNNVTSFVPTENQVSSVSIPTSQPLSQSNFVSEIPSQSPIQSQIGTQYSSNYSISDLPSIPQQTPIQQQSTTVPTSQIENSFYTHHDSTYQHHYPNLYGTNTNPSPYNYAPHATFNSTYSPYGTYHHNPYDLNSFNNSHVTPSVPSSYSTPLSHTPHHHHPPPPPPPPIPGVIPPTSDVGQYQHHPYSHIYPPPPMSVPSATVHHQPPPPPSISEQYNSFYSYSYPPTTGQWRPQ